MIKWIPFLISFSVSAQDLVYNCASNGVIFTIDENCCRKEICHLETYNDIVITNNGRCFAILNSIHELDLANCQVKHEFEPRDEMGINRVGNGLEAINDTLLVTDFNDSLYLININTQQSQFIGYTGKFCAGDIIFKHDFLYMSTSLNEIVRIKLSSDFSSILSTQVIAVISNANLIYGMFDMPSNSDTLIGLAVGEFLYLYDLTSLKLTNYCTLENSDIFGSTLARSSNENGLMEINVLTPNGDGVNDFIIFDNYIGLNKVSVINRWGQEVFKSIEFPCFWAGEDLTGAFLSDGTYYLKLDIEGCGKISDTLVSFITIIK